MKYEVIREIFNLCSGNQMRDVFVSEIDCENPDDYVQQFMIGGDKSMEKSVTESGALVYDLLIDGLSQRLTFTAED